MDAALFVVRRPTLPRNKKTRALTGFDEGYVSYTGRVKDFLPFSGTYGESENRLSEGTRGSEALAWESLRFLRGPPEPPRGHSRIDRAPWPGDSRGRLCP
jgi:hypothetical protein